jgi:predicted acylesterase/phospholipase RssA
VVVAQYRPGQWIGLPQLLRAADQAAGRGRCWPDGGATLHVETLAEARTQTMSFRAALALVDGYADFRRFVEHHVAVRFARRDEMLQRVERNPLLRLLNPADREYLLQLGAIVEAPDASAAYLPAHAPSGRAALLLRGAAMLMLSPGPGREMCFGAGLRPGDLVGHEGLVMDAERGDTPAGNVEIVEPPRTTEVRLAPGAQVLQVNWHALRWVLDDHEPVWRRVKRLLAGPEAGLDAPMPSIVSFYGARAKLGTTMLACGTAAELVNAGGNVEVVDLQGAENFETHWRPAGFEARDRTVTLQAGPRKLRAEGRRTDVLCRSLVPPADAAWPPGLQVVWPVAADPDQADDLVDALEADAGVSHIVVAGYGGDTSGLLDEVRDRLDGRCSTVFYVCDDSGASYPGPEPAHLTWVYRMTPAYLAAERRHARRVRFDWSFAGLIDATPDVVHHAIEDVLGYSPSAELAREAAQEPRRVVRVPDDPAGARAFARGDLGTLIGANAETLALGRAFARLARVVNRRTVGVALGGGGAWGFAHVALLRHLERYGVPVDYIAGTSFGSVVGGLYAVGGMRALDLLVDANSATGPGLGASLRAIATGSLNRALFVAPFASVAVERFIDTQLRAAGTGSAGDPPCLGATEIPFHPVGTNLGTHQHLAAPHATAGWGVRMSGSLPPMFPTLLRGRDHIADGAFSANVPSRVVREAGAHFVIAANVVPPPPAATPASLGWSLLTWLPRQALQRLDDTVRGVFVLAWKAGQDQGALAGDYALDLRPTVANSFEMWRGRDIVEEVEAKHFAGENASRIRDAWDRFCDDRAPVDFEERPATRTHGVPRRR